MKKIFTAVLAVLVAFFFAFGAATAATKEEKLSVNAFLDVSWVSQYIGGMGGGTVFDKDAFQQSLAFTVEPIGLYACVWNSYSPSGGYNSDYGDEYDVFVGIKRSWGGVKFDLGYAFYNMYNLRNTRGDMHGLYFKTEFPEVLGLIPYLWLEKDYISDTWAGGHYYRAGIIYTAKLAKQPINLNLSLAGHDGAFGRRSEPLSSGKAALSTDFPIWKFIVTPQVSYQQRLGYKVEDGGNAENKFWYGINFSVPLF